MESAPDMNGATKGILRPGAIDKRFSLSRNSPSEELSFVVEHYWIVQWDLRGREPYKSETLPFPTVHIVIERKRADVWGVSTGRFTRRLEGEGRAFGIKFKPGAFRSLIGGPVSNLTDRTIPVAKLFGENGGRFVNDVNSLDEVSEIEAVAERFINSLNPQRDSKADTVDRIVTCIMSDRSITSVEQIVKSEASNKRSLQRLFDEYVGVGPRWVISRYRLQEAADRLARQGSVELSQLALELGYFDQAHFIRDFKTIMGMTPGEYSRTSANT